MIYFTQEEHNGNLSLNTDQGLTVHFIMENSKCVEVYLDTEENLLTALDDNLHAIFVMVFKQVHSLAYLVAEANINYEDINKETRQHEIDEANMAHELSSPFLTGRV